LSPGTFHYRAMSATVTALRRPGRPSRSNEELLDLALDLFLEHGFERTSIDAISVAAGMAKRTVYLRYGDKATLFKAALKRAIEEWIVPVERLRAAESDSLEESLLRIGQILVANIMSPAGLRLLRLTNAESGRHPELGAFALQQGTHPTVAYLADLFTRRIGPETLMQVNPVEAADAFLNLVVGGPSNATAWGVVLDAGAIDHHTRYSVELFLHGLLPSQTAEPVHAENLRLKQLLAEAILEASALKARLGDT
jgi:TetR/AcrR family transcriptional repressor of mexJK operon